MAVAEGVSVCELKKPLRWPCHTLKGRGPLGSHGAWWRGPGCLTEGLLALITSVNNNNKIEAAFGDSRYPMGPSVGDVLISRDPGQDQNSSSYYVLSSSALLASRLQPGKRKNLLWSWLSF